MNTVFSDLPCFKQNGWIYRNLVKEDADDLRDLFGFVLNKGQAEIMTVHFKEAFEEKKELVIGAFSDKDMHMKCVFEVYNVDCDECVIGYRCRISQQNHGFTSDSLGGVLVFLRECGIRRVHASAEGWNSASCRILTKNGFYQTKEESGRKYYQKDLIGS